MGTECYKLPVPTLRNIQIYVVTFENLVTGISDVEDLMI